MQKTPVLIVGGGPVGLALACELGWRGIACTLVEQGDGTIVTPKMNEVNIRTMEFCRRWGIADAVHACPFPPDYPLDVVFVTSLSGYELGRIPRPPRRERGAGAPQPDAAAGLLADVVRSDPAAFRPHISACRARATGRGSNSFEQSESGVTRGDHRSRNGPARAHRGRLSGRLRRREQRGAPFARHRSRRRDARPSGASVLPRTEFAGDLRPRAGAPSSSPSIATAPGRTSASSIP